MMYSEAGNRFVVVNPIEQVASVALARLIPESSGLYHIHSSPRVQEPFAGCFQRIQDLCASIRISYFPQDHMLSFAHLKCP